MSQAPEDLGLPCPALPCPALPCPTLGLADPTVSFSPAWCRCVCGSHLRVPRCGAAGSPVCWLAGLTP